MTTWSALRSGMTAAEKVKMRKYRPQVRAQFALTQLRNSRKITQAVVAQCMKVDQAAVSRIEKRGDLHLSTLRNYIKGLGGELELRVKFPQGDSVSLAVDDGAFGKKAVTGESNSRSERRRVNVKTK